MTFYFCSDEERRAAVAASILNGIDFLEVLDSESTDERLRQRLLIVRFLKPGPATLATGNVRIEGGVRISPVDVVWAMMLPQVAGADLDQVPQWQKDAIDDHLGSEAEPDRVFLVHTDSEGDYSRYTLRLLASPTDPTPPSGFDPRLSALTFSFKVECPSDFDCRRDEKCPPRDLTEPLIDYLAKDYSSFRRLLLDRLSVTAPDWRERSPADLGIALVELMAYLGDRLSYYQDAVATESYLGTARRRVSLRRHARLVDYRMHEGVNARAWIHLESGAAADGAAVPAGTRLSTPGDARQTVRSPDDLAQVMREGGVVFETLHEVVVRQGMDRIPFYTWSDRECCLPAGATRATLETAPVPGLEPGVFLLLEEVLGPATGSEADADPQRRHVVRLTAVTTTTDPLDGTPIVEIEWGSADALPFPLCISGHTDDAHGAEYLDNTVSVARGNLVLADHGLTVEGEELGEVPDEPRFFRPRLSGTPVTHSVPLPEGFPADEPRTPAVELTRYDAAAGVPLAVRLESTDGQEWTPVADLLASDGFKREFVLEPSEEGSTVRFGDDVNGREPEPGLGFEARYRVGNGREGNVGAAAISQIFTSSPALASLEGVRNPLPATGGVDAESLDEVRRYAPQAFRKQQRAVTEEDYAVAARAHDEVQEAAATFRWTGSWYTVFVTVDRKGGLPVDAAFEQELREHLSFYRLAGYDLEVDAPRFVPLEIKLMVCVEPDYSRSEVRHELFDVFGCSRLSDGSPGFFHPDRWTFGQPVFRSQVVAAAMAVEGVESVTVKVFKRWARVTEGGEESQRRLAMGRLEIARLDNDPSFQENGLLELEMGGGR